MNSKRGESTSRDRVIGGQMDAQAHLRRQGRRGITALGEVTLVSFAFTAACLLLPGCGGQKTESARVESSAPSSSAASTAVVAAATPVSSQGSATLTGQPQPGISQGLPPEIALGELDTLVTPGQPLQLEVYGTPDVTAMALSDGIGKPEPFYHDASANLWRVSYRVPLRPKQDRLGLSVTAENDLNRWRRVWIFLNVRQPKTETTAAVDTPSAK
jgi:hypothetical protein